MCKQSADKGDQLCYPVFITGAVVCCYSRLLAGLAGSCDLQGQGRSWARMSGAESATNGLSGAVWEVGAVRGHSEIQHHLLLGQAVRWHSVNTLGCPNTQRAKYQLLRMKSTNHLDCSIAFTHIQSRI